MDAEQKKAFKHLLEAITQTAVLHTADFDKPFVFQTDPSSCILGAVLLQEIDGCLQPIAYAYLNLTITEKKAFSTYESERLAVVYGADKFPQYLKHHEFLL